MLGAFKEVELSTYEHPISHYYVQLVQPASDGWVSTMPTLQAVITTHRLLLKPQTVRPRPPASIPGAYVRRVVLNSNNLVSVELREGYQLHLQVRLYQTQPFVADLFRMMRPYARLRGRNQIRTAEIQRIIEQITAL